MLLMLYLKLSLYPRLSKMSYMLSSRSFVVFHFLFRSMIHFESITVKGVRFVFFLVFLHVNAQFFQYHLLQKNIFAPLLCFCSFAKDQLGIFMCLFLGSILFHWSISLFFCSDHTVLNLIPWYLSSKICRLSDIDLVHILLHFYLSIWFWGQC